MDNVGWVEGMPPEQIADEFVRLANVVSPEAAAGYLGMLRAQEAHRALALILARLAKTTK